MDFDVKDIIILVELGIIVFMFLSSRNDISPEALKSLATVAITTLRNYADKTPSTLDNTLLDFADNLVKSDNKETTEVQAVKVTKKDTD